MIQRRNLFSVGAILVLMIAGFYFVLPQKEIAATDQGDEYAPLLQHARALRMGTAPADQDTIGVFRTGSGELLLVGLDSTSEEGPPVLLRLLDWNRYRMRRTEPGFPASAQGLPVAEFIDHRTSDTIMLTFGHGREGILGTWAIPGMAPLTFQLLPETGN